MPGELIGWLLPNHLGMEAEEPIYDRSSSVETVRDSPVQVRQTPPVQLVPRTDMRGDMQATKAKEEKLTDMRGEMQATEAKEEKQLAQPRCKKMPRAPQAVQPEPIVDDDDNKRGGAGARQAHSTVRATAQRSSARITASRSGKRKRSPLAAEGGDAAVAAVAAVVAGGAGAARAATGAQGAAAAPAGTGPAADAGASRAAASPGATTTSSAGTASPSKLPCSPSLQPREVASRWRSGASMSSRCSR